MITDTSNVIFIDPDTDRMRWLTYRRSGIGGSDVAGICGISPFSSPVKVWMSKIEDIRTDEEEPEFFRWGRILESPICEEYQRLTGKAYKKVRGVLQHKEYPWAIGSLDGEFESDSSSGVLEIKTSNMFKKHAWDDDKIPDHYMAQVQWYMFLSGYKVADIACLIGGQNLILREGIPRNEEMIRHLVHICERFWNDYVLPQKPPPVDGSEVSSKLLKTMYPSSSGNSIELGTSGGELLAKLYSVKTAINELEGEKRLYENRVKEILKDAESGTINGDVGVTWRTETVNRFDSKRFQNDHPSLYSRYLKQSKQRRFIPKQPKGV